MATSITREHIESVVEGLPIQNRNMIRLMLLQYLELTEEDIEYMAADRPDPRFQQGGKSLHSGLSRDAIKSVEDRAEQYRTQVRQKRERIWLQIECLRKQLAQSEGLATLAEEMLRSKFSFAPEAIDELKKNARIAVHRPALRALEKKWERDEVSEDEYRRERLPMLFQAEIRRAQRFQTRLDLAMRELATVNQAPLQDHEIAHIWGIPLSSLAGRKVKALCQYLKDLEGKTKAQDSISPDPTGTPVDLWKETFATLSASPVQRSVAPYEGMEGSEQALLDKLTAFATGSLTDEVESRFWQTVSRDYSPNAVEGQGKRQSLFALQRLSTILTEMDPSPENLEQELLTKISPRPKVLAGETDQPPGEAAPQLSEMAEHVLRSFRGEDRA